MEPRKQKKLVENKKQEKLNLDIDKVESFLKELSELTDIFDARKKVRFFISGIKEYEREGEGSIEVETSNFLKELGKFFQIETIEEIEYYVKKVHRLLFIERTSKLNDINLNILT